MEIEVFMWVFGGLGTLIVLLVSYIHVNSLKTMEKSFAELSKNIEESNRRHEHHYKKDQEQDLQLQKNSIEILSLQRKEPFDSEKFADSIVMKIKAITPQNGI